MGLKTVALFIVLATLSTSTAFNTVTPWDKEVVYDWRALVKAGTFFPARFASQFILQGKVHVQANNNATHVKITDLTYKLYNGKLDHVQEHKAHSVPVPHEVQDIHNVFKIVHDEHGHAIGIATEHQEKEFSRNIKRAVASVLQVHDSVVKEQLHHPHTFISHEHSIHGYGEVHYNVVPHHDETVHVHKMHQMHDSHHIYQYFVTNTESVGCELGFEEPIMHSSVKKYVIGKQDGHHVVKHIEADGAIMYYPHKAQSVGQYILTNQTFKLEQVVPVQEKFQVKQEHYDNHLNYHPFEETEHDLHDVTNGRHVVDYGKLVPQVKEILQEIQHYFQKDHIHTGEPDIKQGQAVNRVQRMLRRFSFEKLKELHETLTGETLKVYQHILPLVGSKPAALLVKHLVVHKSIPEDIAVEMLQHFPEHMVFPTTELVTELEELIHLSEEIPWKVRKVAILSFASLIHKSHKYHVEKQHREQQQHVSQSHVTNVGQHHHVGQRQTPKDENHALEKPYEKYVLEYINKLKTSQDYKVQMTYALGLYNMKLHSVIEHIIPALNGEWWQDRHLRFLALTASGPAVLAEQDPHVVLETYWPIMTNREEHTELRILAYYFIMESKPTLSTLKNIAWFMLTEPNEEVYHYHYTYVQAMMKTTEPCRQDTRVKMAQMMKFMNPPSHGQSTVYDYTYKDASYGFSTSVGSHFVHTNESQLYFASLTTQDTNIMHEDYMIYMKVHGIHHPDRAVTWTKFLGMKIPQMNNVEGLHVELAIFRHGHVINSYYFDEHNISELRKIIDFFIARESHSITDDLLHISYPRFHTALIPTELGIPALWEFLMPNVHQHNISISKEVSNNVLNIHIHNRYVQWAHHRDGLTFYNPIADVWQGVNSFHVYDAVLPVHLDIAFNMPQQSVQISWNKHDNPLMNVAGLRAYSVQMTFVKDDYQRNILGQSSPHSKEWEVVTNGKEYRNDYTLVDEDDLNTGHKWYVGKFDCGYHVSNGSFGHQMYLFNQPFTKHVESPDDHLMMSYLNFHHYALLSPKPGACGFIMRIEPSHEHVVSNIDLSVRIHQEKTEEEKYQYTPGHKISTRFTYAVKNKEQSLKTWDMSAIIDMNPGHTINNLKMHLTRIIPGQKDYKVCVDGVQKWVQKEVSGHLNVAMSQTPDGKCVKDDTVIDVTMTGKKSYAQEHKHHIYRSCHYMMPYSVPEYRTLHCLAAHTSVRHYVYNVKTTNVPTEFKKTFARWWDQIKGNYMPYYTYEDEHNEDVAENNLKVDVVYPMNEHEVDVHITTPHHVYGLTGVPTEYWRPWILTPDSLAYSMGFFHAHTTGQVDHCVVHHDHHHLNHHHRVEEAVPNEWTLYVADHKENPHKAVYVKHVADDKIAVKVVDQGHNFEIVPHGEHHQITVDGKVVPIEEHEHYEDWVSFIIFHDTLNHPVTAVLQMSGFHLEYDGHHVVIVTLEGKDWQGHCYAHH